MIILVLHWTSNRGEKFQLRVQTMRDEIYRLTARKPAIRTIRRHLEHLEERGLVNRRRCNREKQLPGKLPQVTFYEIPDLIKAIRAGAFPIFTYSPGALAPVTIPGMTDRGKNPTQGFTFYRPVLPWPPQ